MKKNLIRLLKLDGKSTFKSSVVELILPTIIIIVTFLLGSFSTLLLKVIFIMSLILCLALAGKGLSFSLLVNYVDSHEKLLEYFSIKYCVVSCIVIVVMIAAYTLKESADLYFTFMGLISAIPFLLTSYLLLFFYSLSTTEPELISVAILFLVAAVIYNLGYYVFGLINIWAIPAVFVLYYSYFRYILPLLSSVYLNRYEIIMEKIL